MIRKIIIILIAISALKLITSCIFRCDCDDPEEVEFSLNTSQISTIDNAGPYPDYNTKTDSIPAGAIGFNIKLSDSTLMEKYYMVAAPKSQCRIFPYFIKGAYAWS
ncbi:MAG TPA: hypothetical protein VJ909_08030, partial [Prolixibacteraceae bacterium]|nr:hypothetical protein [Prolixibacteraceae bacterium]